MTEDAITITRVFEAPRERVWLEWTEPERFADWFGGTTNEVPMSSVEMDVRAGGVFRLTMVTARGEVHWHGEYQEVDEPSRVVFTLTDQPPGTEYALITVDLVDLGDGRTEMRFEQRGPMPEAQARAAREGWLWFFDRIAERLQ
jgi:uncharacterized protein YndB with AHSA1/START domain